MSMVSRKGCPPTVALTRYSRSKLAPATGTVVLFPRRAESACVLDGHRGACAAKGTETSAGGSRAASCACGASETWRVKANSARTRPATKREKREKIESERTPMGNGEMRGLERYLCGGDIHGRDAYSGGNRSVESDVT